MSQPPNRAESTTMGLFTNNLLLDRIATAICLLFAWGLSAFFVYIVYFTPRPMALEAWYWAADGIVCSICMPFFAFIFTFPSGMLRYVLTGHDFPKGFE